MAEKLTSLWIRGKKLKISYFGNLILDNNSKGEVDFFQAETFNTT